jgi:hypothetical protein
VARREDQRDQRDRDRLDEARLRVEATPREFQHRRRDE